MRKLESVELYPVVAVVNHLGERLVINLEDYHRGQWQLWQEPTSGASSGSELTVLEKSRRKRKDNGYPSAAR